MKWCSPPRPVAGCDAPTVVTMNPTHSLGAHREQLCACRRVGQKPAMLSPGAVPVSRVLAEVLAAQTRAKKVSSTTSRRGDFDLPLAMDARENAFVQSVTSVLKEGPIVAAIALKESSPELAAINLSETYSIPLSVAEYILDQPIRRFFLDPSKTKGV